MTTDVIRCSIVELFAIDRAIRGDRQRELLLGLTPWTRRDRAFLERLRDVRGLNVIEDHSKRELHVTICGSLTVEGFKRKL